MTITTSLNAVGVLRATELQQSARAKAAVAPHKGADTATAEIPRSIDAERQARDSDRPVPASQKRVVDIQV